MAKRKEKIHKTEEAIPDFFEEIRENPYFQWIVERRQAIPYVFLCILLLIIGTYKFTAGRAAKAESSYLLADNYFNVLHRSLREGQGESAQNALEKLKDITDNYPELHSRYDGPIAQLLLVQGNDTEAQELAERSLERTADEDLSFYVNFTRTSLLINNGEYESALEKAKSLKEKLIDQAESDTTHRNFGDSLFAYNLLRIAMLEQEIASPEGELEAWEEWKRYAGLSKEALPSDFIATDAFATLNQQLGEGDFSLNHYIDLRIKKLMKRNTE